jgi:hypothetical protein
MMNDIYGIKMITPFQGLEWRGKLFRRALPHAIDFGLSALLKNVLFCMAEQIALLVARLSARLKNTKFCMTEQIALLIAGFSARLKNTKFCMTEHITLLVARFSARLKNAMFCKAGCFVQNKLPNQIKGEINIFIPHQGLQKKAESLAINSVGQRPTERSAQPIQALKGRNQFIINYKRK